MKNKKRAGFKMKKSAAKMFAPSNDPRLYEMMGGQKDNFTDRKRRMGIRTWDDYFDQDRFDSRAVNKRLTKSQRQAKIAQKKKDFEKEQATIRQLMLGDLNEGRPNPYAPGGALEPMKAPRGLFGVVPGRPRKFSGGVSQVGNMASQLAPFTMKRGSKPNKSEFFKGKK